MKKTLLFLVVIFIISCSKEEIQNSENQELYFEQKQNSDSKNTNNSLSCMEIEQNSEDFLLNSDCSLILVNPFVNVSNTYSVSFGGSPSYENFNDRLKWSLVEEVYNSNGINMHQMQRPSARSLIYSGVDYIYLSQIIDTSDLYPYISAQKANSVYSHAACKYVNEIQDLYVSNPIPTSPQIQIYSLEITNLNVDFSICGGPSATYATIYYSIYKETF